MPQSLNRLMQRRPRRSSKLRNVFPTFLYEKFIAPLKVTFIRRREVSLKKLTPTDTTMGRTLRVVRGCKAVK